MLIVRDAAPQPRTPASAAFTTLVIDKGLYAKGSMALPSRRLGYHAPAEAWYIGDVYPGQDRNTAALTGGASHGS